MNYHAQGNTISRDYFKLVEMLAGEHFVANNEKLVALSLPGAAWFLEHRPVLQRAIPPLAWDRDGWPVSLCHRLSNEWMGWRRFAHTGQGGPRSEAARQRAVQWCVDNSVPRTVGLDPGAPWHIPFLCTFAFAADAAATNRWGYYEALRNLFQCNLEDNALARLTAPSWAVIWKGVADWARDANRGFMLAELPEHFTYVGWPQQHVLLVPDERRQLAEWLLQLWRHRPTEFTVNELQKWIRARPTRSKQLNSTDGSVDRLRLLHHWASQFLQTERRPEPDEGGGDNRPEPVPFAPPDLRPSGHLIVELQDGGEAVSSAYLGASEVVESIAVGEFEFGGSQTYLRKTGLRRPLDLRSSMHLLSDTNEITKGQIRWANASRRYFVNEQGEWIEESARQISRPVSEEVLVLCTKGSEAQYVEGEWKLIKGLDGRYAFLRCRAEQLVGIPAPLPRVLLESGIRLLPASQTEYFGVALPRILNERPVLHTASKFGVTVAADGKICVDEAMLNANVPERIEVPIEAAEGARRSIAACFPKQRPSDLPSEVDFSALAERSFPDGDWSPTPIIELTPLRRLLCVYSADSTSQAVFRDRLARLFGGDPTDRRLLYLLGDLADLGHLIFSEGADPLEGQAATAVVGSDARIEVIARISGNEHAVVARLVGAHDWVRLRGLHAEGVEWLEFEGEIFVRGSLSTIREFAESRNTALVRCDRICGTVDAPSVLQETLGLPWDDGAECVLVRNPLYPLRGRTLCCDTLKALVGIGGTFVLRHETQFTRNYYRIRWDGRTWQRAGITPRLAADHYWASVRSGWHRYGMVMEGTLVRIPILYSEASRAVYCLPRLRPPSEIRIRLCSLAGGLPTLMQTSDVGRIDFAGAAVGRMYEGSSELLRYSGVSKEQAVQVAEALGAYIFPVG